MCDPACQLFDEDPEGGLVIGGNLDWTQGAVTDLPSSLQTKALSEPCRSGADCQLNHRCEGMVTQASCAHDKCEPGAPLAANCDPCVARVCAQDPSCCAPTCKADEVQGPNQSSCYFHGKSETNWANARAACQSRGAGWDLVSIDSGSENAFLLTLTQTEGYGPTWTGLKRDATTPWAWSNGSPFSYTQWVPGAPSTGGWEEWCGELEYGGWRNFNCTSYFDYLCEGPSGGAPACEHDLCSVGAALKTSCDSCVASICAIDPSCCDPVNGSWSAACAARVPTVCDRPCSCEPGEVLHAGQCYFTENRALDWPSASQSCQARGEGWQLADPNDAAENAFLDSLSYSTLWLGISDRTTEGTWLTSRGRTLNGSTYASWLPGEPNGSLPTADCLESRDGGVWNDEDCGVAFPSVCEGPATGAASGWSSRCVDLAETTCDATCDAPRNGECSAWLPGEQDAKCGGVDLAVGVPCDGQIPVCNHGTETAPAGVKLALFPSGSGQYPACDPDLSKPGVTTCSTDREIAPGQCISVSGCPGLDTEREIVVNPPGAGRAAECSCLDNWGLSRPGLACRTPVCVEAERSTRPAKLRLAFAVDRSSSMANGGKWAGTVEGLRAFFSAPSSAGLGVSLELFPLAASSTTGDGCASGVDCSAETCAAPLVPQAELTASTGGADAQETALIAALTEQVPGGPRPTSAALAGALETARARAGAADEVDAVVLVTDGDPTRCETSWLALEELASQGRDAGVLTYVLALPGANPTAAASLARAGGGKAFFVAGANAADIASRVRSALLELASQSLSCSFEFGESPYADTGNTSVSLDTGSGPSALSRVDSAAACSGAGFYFDDPVRPSRVELCPDSCTSFRSTASAQVKLSTPCLADAAAERHVEIYAAECGPGRKVQWGFLAWNGSTPEGSSIAFAAQTATTEGALRDAPRVSLATASTALGTESCGFGSSCFVDLYEELGVPAVRREVLRLIIDLKRGAASSAAPTLNRWELTYSCPFAE
jgi:hypothetical protein